ncbi:MAG: type II toxin-antitoxin system HicB family antitoxin [Rivularia sp. ALOHA_DT_140]|nr:type II toxin-antitoxin system HicB family antitoxin [Rivularia sp. ALOHA_DT_140]
MKSLKDYTIVLRPDDNNTFVAYVPAIPGCHAWGETLDEACAELVNVFEIIQEEYPETEISNSNKLNLNHNPTK